MLAIRAGAKSAATVALCSENDPELEELAIEVARERSIQLQIVVQPASGRAATFRLKPDLTAIERACNREPRLSGGQLQMVVPISAGHKAHAAVFFDGAWHPGDSPSGRRLTLLSHPDGYGFGMYVLGEALIARELAR